VKPKLRQTQTIVTFAYFSKILYHYQARDRLLENFILSHFFTKQPKKALKSLFLLGYCKIRVKTTTHSAAKRTLIPEQNGQ